MNELREAAVIGFTMTGYRLGEKIAQCLKDEGISVRLAGCGTWTKEEKEICRVSSLREWTGERFADSRLLIFVGACGIAVRAIAPFLKGKWEDPAVLVADERGTYVIPILSGHEGGANEAACCLAKALGAQPVLTTATDVNGIFAVDEFARKNRLLVTDKKLAGQISAVLLAGSAVGLAAGIGCRPEGRLPQGLVMYEEGEKNLPVFGIWIGNMGETMDRPGGNLWERTLVLKPRQLCIGIGCRRGVSEEQVARAVSCALADGLGEEEDIEGLYSVSLKEAEPGILAYCRRRRIPFETFPPGRLQAVPGRFTSSELVKQVTGTDNVCERAAVLGSGMGRLLSPKRIVGPVTVAAAQRKRGIRF